MSCGSSVDTATDCLRLDDQGVGVQVPLGSRIFTFPVLESSRTPIQWVLVALAQVVKRQGREADHSPPTSADVKKTGMCTSTPPYAWAALPYLFYFLAITNIPLELRCMELFMEIKHKHN
jgi:hypothetical protein